MVASLKGRSPPPPGQAARGFARPAPPMAPGRGPDVRYLTNVPYVHHRTISNPVSQCGESRPAEDRKGLEHVVVVGLDVDEAVLVVVAGADNVALPDLADIGVAAAVPAPAAQGFPAREQFGGLELELLHRDVSGHGCLLRGRSPPGP